MGKKFKKYVAKSGDQVPTQLSLQPKIALLNKLSQWDKTNFYYLKFLSQDPSSGLLPAGGLPLDWLTFSLPQSWHYLVTAEAEAIGRCQYPEETGASARHPGTGEHIA